MSYCRFENTYSDLRDVYEHIDSRTLSEDECRARKNLIALCQRIIDEAENIDEDNLNCVKTDDDDDDGDG
jgi:hypothetical protein